MAQLYENKLRRFKLANRRGVWTTWGAPCTWGSCLIRSDGPDLASQLAQCASVLDARDVTQEVFAKQFVPPEHPWSLLVESPYQQWATFADDRRYNEALDNLHAEFSGETLRTGAVDDFGTVYVRYWKNGEQVLEFTTDGMGWPTPPEDVWNSVRIVGAQLSVYNYTQGA